MKSRNNPRFGRLGLFLAGLAFFAWACQLTQEPEKERVLSLGALADSLVRYDSVQIILKDPSGKFLDTVYSGPVTGREDLIDRPVPHYDGGKAVITLIAYEDGKVVLQVDRIYDGKTGKVDSVMTIILAESAVLIDNPKFTLLVGEDAPLPAVTVTPERLSDKTVLWTSSDTLVVKLIDGRYAGVSRGTAVLTVRLKSDESKSASFSVRVDAKLVGDPPVSLRLQPDYLGVAVKSVVRNFDLTVEPASANKDVTWHSADTLKARFVPGGVEGLAPGTVKVWAVSMADTTVADTAWVVVQEEFHVTKVDLLKDSLKVMVGGAPETLEVVVEPSLALFTAFFTVRDTTKAKVVDGKVVGLAPGETWIVASSTFNPSLLDSVRVVVTEPHKVVDSVALDREGIQLYTGGFNLVLKATVHPFNTSQAVRWISSNPEVAAVDSLGKVSPVSPGITHVRAVSRQDSLKMDSAKVTVKRDFPILSINDEDTTVSVGSTVVFHPEVVQEYGVVNGFEWDLDGNGFPDGTSDTLRAVSLRYADDGEYPARFRVRDTEGNQTEVIKKVKVVKVPVILIKSPADSSLSNQTVIGVSWSVDGVDQTGGITETLAKEGANTVTREARDAAGKVFAASITVILDTIPPAKPPVRSATTYTDSRTPRWTWSTGGLGGNGTYRVRLDTAIDASNPALHDTAWQPPVPLGEGPHTLHVQERDEAGNWSATGSFTVVVDLTPVSAPVVTSSSLLTKDARPEWTWKSGGPEGSRIFRSRLDAADLSDAAPTSDTSFIPSSDLPEGSHTLFVQERDSAGNWSASGSLKVRIDRTPPGRPIFTSQGLSPLNHNRLSWYWTSGGNGDMGAFRISVDTPNFPDEGWSLCTNCSAFRNQTEGPHTAYVQERDSAGNWSPTASQTLYISYRDTVGNRGLSGGAASIDFAISPQGVPHLVLRDNANSGKASVMSYSGGMWSYVGNPGFTPGLAVAPRLAFNKDGVPFIVFNDATQSYHPSVMAFKGGVWVVQGGTLPSTGPQSPAIAVSPAGNPIVAYSSSGNLRVDSLGSGWGNPGNPTIPADPIVPFSIAYSSDNVLYVAYRAGDGAPNMGSAVVQRRVGGIWQEAGSGLPTNVISSISLAMNGTTPQVAIAGGGTLSVYSLSGSAWTAIGQRDFATSYSISLSVDAAGRPVVAYPDGANNKVAVKAFYAGAWYSMSSTGLSYGAGENVCVAVDQATGVPFVAFTEPANGRKITVMKTAFDPP